MDIQAYFDRIGYTGSPEPTVQNLEQLLRCHLQTVPFENLDCWPRGKALTNDPDILFEKVVLRRRGGVCFELNSLLYYLLKELGYICYPVSVRIHLGPGPAPITHAGVVAEVEGKKYYCDVGFGGPGPKGLVPMEGARELVMDGQPFRFTREDLTFSIHRFHDERWSLLISFLDVPCIPQDFTARLYYFSTHPESRFVTVRLVNLCLSDGGSLALTDNTFTARRGGQVTQRTLETEEEVTKVLQEEFGLFL